MPFDTFPVSPDVMASMKKPDIVAQELTRIMDLKGKLGDNVKKFEQGFKMLSRSLDAIKKVGDAQVKAKVEEYIRNYDTLIDLINELVKELTNEEKSERVGELWTDLSEFREVFFAKKGALKDSDAKVGEFLTQCEALIAELEVLINDPTTLDLDKIAALAKRKGEMKANGQIILDAVDPAASNKSGDPGPSAGAGAASSSEPEPDPAITGGLAAGGGSTPRGATSSGGDGAPAAGGAAPAPTGSGGKSGGRGGAASGATRPAPGGVGKGAPGAGRGPGGAAPGTAGRGPGGAPRPPGSGPTSVDLGPKAPDLKPKQEIKIGTFELGEYDENTGILKVKRNGEEAEVDVQLMFYGHESGVLERLPMSEPLPMPRCEIDEKSGTVKFTYDQKGRNTLTLFIDEKAFDEFGFDIHNEKGDQAGYQAKLHERAADFARDIGVARDKFIARFTTHEERERLKQGVSYDENTHELKCENTTIKLSIPGVGDAIYDEDAFTYTFPSPAGIPANTFKFWIRSLPIRDKGKTRRVKSVTYNFELRLKYTIGTGVEEQRAFIPLRSDDDFKREITFYLEKVVPGLVAGKKPAEIMVEKGGSGAAPARAAASDRATVIEPVEGEVILEEIEKDRIEKVCSYDPETSSIVWGETKVPVDIEDGEAGRIQCDFDPENWTGKYEYEGKEATYSFRVRSLPGKEKQESKGGKDGKKGQKQQSAPRSNDALFGKATGEFVMVGLAQVGSQPGRMEIRSARDLETFFKVLKSAIIKDITGEDQKGRDYAAREEVRPVRQFEETAVSAADLPASISEEIFTKSYGDLFADYYKKQRWPIPPRETIEQFVGNQARIIKHMVVMAEDQLPSSADGEGWVILPEAAIKMPEVTSISVGLMAYYIDQAGLEVIEQRNIGSNTKSEIGALKVRRKPAAKKAKASKKR